MGCQKKAKISVYNNTRVCIVVVNGMPDQETEVSATARIRDGGVAIGCDAFAFAARVVRRAAKPLPAGALPGVERGPSQDG